MSFLWFWPGYMKKDRVSRVEHPHLIFVFGDAYRALPFIDRLTLIKHSHLDSDLLHRAISLHPALLLFVTTMSGEKKEVNTEPLVEDKPKPCCVCLPEKDERDQCILMNGQESEKCKPFIEEYRKCMESHGFKI